MRLGTGKSGGFFCLAAWVLLLVVPGCGTNGKIQGDDSTVEQETPVTFFSGTVPRNMAHRGGVGLFPENTLYAFEHSLAMGVQIIETDVWRTKDGHVVILHDEEVDRTTSGHGSIKSMTLDQVKELDAAWWFTLDGGETYPLRGQGITIPTLEEAFIALPNVRFLIEIKQERPHIETDVLDLIRSYGMEERICLGSFFDGVLERVLKQAPPDMCTGAGILGIILFLVTPLDILQSLDVPMKAFQIPEEELGIPVLTPEFVEKADALGIEVHVWTINAVEDMRRILAMGVHGIITDYPDRLEEVLMEDPG